MEILTREELERNKNMLEKQWNEGCWENKLISTALALMDERDKMKGEIEKLREKYEKRKKALNKIYEGAFDRSALTMIIQDLSSIGKEEK